MVATNPSMIGRLLNSKKAIYAMIPVLANTLGQLFGFDIMAPAMLILDSAFGLLVIAQTLLDFKWGSQSDGTSSVVK